jgi:hypothetical protein
MNFSSRRQPNTQRTVAVVVCALSLVIFLFVGYRLLASPSSPASHSSSAHQQKHHPQPPHPQPPTVASTPTPPPVIAMAISEADKELLVETDSKSSNSPVGVDHSAVKNPDPTYEWQLFTSDSSFPPGLEFRLALDGSDRKEVRIPHTWRIQLNIGQDYHLFRADIERTTKVWLCFSFCAP